MTSTDNTVDTLNCLLRGELSAIETYSQAIHKLSGSGPHPLLATMRSEHQQSVGILRRLIKERGGDPVTDSGVWGVFAKAVEGAAVAMGTGPAVAALKQGEEHGMKEYEDALKDENLDPAVREAIRNELLPALERHLLNLVSITS